MYNDFNSIKSYVEVIKRNTNFLDKILSPRIGIPVIAFIGVVIGALLFLS
jgi:tetrahydromethanopterin S-methyltransferase subunit F